MYKYYKYVLITLTWCIASASFASDNIQKTTNNFNFKNLSAQQKYGALEYGVYDPAKAIEMCTIRETRIPAGVIWPADPNTIHSHLLNQVHQIAKLALKWHMGVPIMRVTLVML